MPSTDIDGSPVVIFSEAEAREFDDRLKRFLRTAEEFPYVLEPKMDGCAVELVYEHGRFTVGSTRGDGYRGENVTQNLKTIHTIPLGLLTEAKPAPELLEVRGEVFFNREDFEALNAEYTKLAQETRDAQAAMQADLAAIRSSVESIEQMMHDVG